MSLYKWSSRAIFLPAELSAEDATNLALTTGRERIQRAVVAKYGEQKPLCDEQLYRLPPDERLTERRLVGFQLFAMVEDGKSSKP